MAFSPRRRDRDTDLAVMDPQQVHRQRGRPVTGRHPTSMRRSIPPIRRATRRRTGLFQPTVRASLAPTSPRSRAAEPDRTCWRGRSSFHRAARRYSAPLTWTPATMLRWG